MEETLWKNGLLGDHNAQVLLDTLLYLTGLNFALRSGEEHRWFRHKPSQINFMNPENEAPYIAYTEDISKTNQGGKSKKYSQMCYSIHHANLQNPSRCLVQLFVKYNQICPSDHPDGALYLTPLRTRLKSTGIVVFQLDTTN